MTESVSTKKGVVRGVAWASAANWGCQLLAFGVYTGMARLLNPHAFGLVSIAGVYVTLIQVFVTQGFGMAIIQRRSLEREHLESAFWIALATASSFCLLTSLLRSYVAGFFGEPTVAPVLSWLSISLLFFGLSSIPTAILTRELDFRTLAIRSLIATAVGGVVGLTMAMAGFGVWSLVGQQLVVASLGCIYLWRAVRWRPRLRLSHHHLRDLYGFSLSVTGTDVLWFFAQKSDQTMVGHGFGSMGLGPYSLASRLSSLVHDAIVGPVQSVAFPVFSKLQAEPFQLERAVQKFCETCSLFSFPIFAGIIAIAPDLIPALFGAKWNAAVPLLQVLAVYGAFRCALGFMHPLMLANGRPGLYLVMNVVLAAITFAGCLIGARWNPTVIAVSMVVTIAIFFVLFLVVASALLNVRMGPLLKTFLVPALCSLFMLLSVTLIRSLLIKFAGPIATTLICVLSGILIYVAGAFLISPKIVRGVWGMVAGKLLPSTA